MKTLSRFIAILPLLSSCIGPYSIELPFHGPKLVIDGLISSEAGESHVNIGWTFPSGEGCFSSFSDTPQPTLCPPDTARGGQFLVHGTMEIADNAGNIYHFSFRMHDKASYITIDLPFNGVPGREYFLNLHINYKNENEEYAANTVMRETPEIKAISYEIRKGDIGKNDNYVPLIDFLEPQNEDNYYLFRLCYADTIYGGYCGFDNRVWAYSLLSDTFLPNDVRSLSIDDGATVAKYAEFYPHVGPGDGMQVRMYSTSRETYEFYKALIEQFNNDGGAYSPTPATPQGNISGDAIGIFRAMHMSAAEVYI